MKKNLLCVTALLFSLFLSSCSGTTQNKQVNASEVTTLLEQYSSSLTTLKIERKTDRNEDSVFHLKDKVVGELKGEKSSDNMDSDIKTNNETMQLEETRTHDDVKTKTQIKNNVQTIYYFEDGNYKKQFKKELEKAPLTSEYVNAATLLDELKTTKDFFAWEKIEQNNGSYKYKGTLNNEKDYINELKKIYKASLDENIQHSINQVNFTITYTFTDSKRLSSIHLQNSFVDTTAYKNEQTGTIDEKEVSYDKSIINADVITDIVFKN